MFVFALAAGFRDGVPNAYRVRQLMDGFPAAAADGTRVVDAGSAAAGVSRWVVVRRDRDAEPSWDVDRGLLFAGDVRLYNRPELAAELQLPGAQRDAPDLELARLAYLRWGEAAPLHLVGDFAFAAWDERRRTLFAARDHLGMRPLHYRLLPDGVAVASDVAQILALVEDPLDEVSAQRILDRFTRRTRDLRRTFFSGIARLRPGHRLVVDEGGARETRYWLPPAPPAETLTYEAHGERLRALFRRAVRDRLESDVPLVAHSSGGFDSSTVIMAADRIYRDEPGRPPLVMASAVAPGFPSDESAYMDAVAARVAFESVRWRVIDDAPAAFPGVARAAPALDRGLGGGPRRDLDLARERGARVLLTGLAGDELWHAGGVLRDVVRAGRWGHALHEVALLAEEGPHAARRRLRHLGEAALGVLPPPAALAVARRLARGPGPPRRWMGPALRALYPVRADRLDLPNAAWRSHLACSLWARLTSAQTGVVIDGMVDYGSAAGIEVRAPFADVRLIEQVLAIPWQQREPHGHYRRTGRDALGPWLPPEFSKRVGQQPWTEVGLAVARRAARAVAPFIESGPWLSAPFVDRGVARAMLADVLSRGENADAEDCLVVPELGALEAWLRRLLG